MSYGITDWESVKTERPDLWEEPVRLSEIQQDFTVALALLVLEANGYDTSELRRTKVARRYGLTYGTAYRTEAENKRVKGHPRSTHLNRLAVDFNIFRNGVYLQGGEAERAHNELHDFWDTLGGAQRISNDLNHYSFEYQGVR